MSKLDDLLTTLYHSYDSNGPIGGGYALSDAKDGIKSLLLHYAEDNKTMPDCIDYDDFVAWVESL